MWSANVGITGMSGIYCILWAKNAMWESSAESQGGGVLLTKINTCRQSEKAFDPCTCGRRKGKSSEAEEKLWELYLMCLKLNCKITLRFVVGCYNSS